MHNPDKQGGLLKQGHGKFAGFKQRLVHVHQSECIVASAAVVVVVVVAAAAAVVVVVVVENRSSSHSQQAS